MRDEAYDINYTCLLNQEVIYILRRIHYADQFTFPLLFNKTLNYRIFLITILKYRIQKNVQNVHVGVN